MGLQCFSFPTFVGDFKDNAQANAWKGLKEKKKRFDVPMIEGYITACLKIEMLLDVLLNMSVESKLGFQKSNDNQTVPRHQISVNSLKNLNNQIFSLQARNCVDIFSLQ